MDYDGVGFIKRRFFNMQSLLPDCSIPVPKSFAMWHRARNTFQLREAWKTIRMTHCDCCRMCSLNIEVGTPRSSVLNCTAGCPAQSHTSCGRLQRNELYYLDNRLLMIPPISIVRQGTRCEMLPDTRATLVTGATPSLCLATPLPA